MIVFKILRPEDWRLAKSTSEYYGSADDIRDGFVHLSAAVQLPGTLARHFSADKTLQLLVFDTADLGDALKWETSRGGEKFPHFYGALPVGKAIAAQPLTRGPDGEFLLPAFPPAMPPE